MISNVKKFFKKSFDLPLSFSDKYLCCGNVKLYAYTCCCVLLSLGINPLPILSVYYNSYLQHYVSRNVRKCLKQLLFIFCHHTLIEFFGFHFIQKQCFIALGAYIYINNTYSLVIFYPIFFLMPKLTTKIFKNQFSFIFSFERVII